MFEIISLKNNKKILSKRNNPIGKEKYLKYMCKKNVRHNYSQICNISTRHTFLFGRAFKDFIYGIRQLRMLQHQVFNITSNKYDQVKISMHIIKSVINTIKLFNIKIIRYHQLKQNFYDIYIIDSLIKYFKFKHVFIHHEKYEIEISYTDNVVVNKNYSMLKDLHFVKHHFYCEYGGYANHNKNSKNSLSDSESEVNSDNDEYSNIKTYC